MSVQTTVYFGDAYIPRILTPVGSGKMSHTKCCKGTLASAGVFLQVDTVQGSCYNVLAALAALQDSDGDPFPPSRVRTSVSQDS